MEIIYIPQSSKRIYEVITLNGGDPSNRNCSPCSNCNECLADRAYFVWWHNKYCCRCFEKLYGQKCAFCHQAITGSKEIHFIFYNNQMWHAECFRCPKCYNRLTQTCSSPTHITRADCGSRIRSTSR